MPSAIERIRGSASLLKPGDASQIETIEMHTGGEPLRIILNGVPDMEAKSILGYRRIMKSKYDHIRTALMWEPRGHPDMYGVLLLPPERPDSAFGVLFMHNAGYSTMCGHATIALAKIATELGWVEMTEPRTEFMIDAPCGQLACFANVENGRVTSSGFLNVPSFLAEHQALVILDDGQQVKYDLAYGGAFYAFVDVNQFGKSITPENTRFFIDKGMEIKRAVTEQSNKIEHPFEDDLSFLYGTIFIGPTATPNIHSRNVCMFADGEIDRSPTGSGISGRAAIYSAMGQLSVGEQIEIESILGSTMQVSVLKKTSFGPYDAIIPKVSGQAWITGRSTFMIDPEDPLRDGFLLR